MREVQPSAPTKGQQRFWRQKNPLVDGEEVKLAVHVHRVGLSQVTQLLQSLIDEDHADEGGEGFFGEAGDVAHQRAGIGGHQHYAEEGGPQPDARPQRQIGERVLPGKPREKQGWKGQQEAPSRAFLWGKLGAI